jgi:RimJ/RimL family protein N-acetyltransferase
MAAITSSTEQRPEAGLRSYLVKEVLRDGTHVTIRAIRKDDQTSIRAAFRMLDREAVYSRFFSPKTDLTNAELEEVTDLDFRQAVALVATVSEGDGEEIVIGDGRYVTIDGEQPDSKRAELAFIVANRYRGRGIASLLLTHLARIAQQAGVTAFEAEVLAYNEPMLAVLQRSGFPVCRKHESDIVHVTLCLASQAPRAK